MVSSKKSRWDSPVYCSSSNLTFKGTGALVNAGLVWRRSYRPIMDHKQWKHFSMLGFKEWFYICLRFLLMKEKHRVAWDKGSPETAVSDAFQWRFTSPADWGPRGLFLFFFKFVKLKWIKESTFVLVSFKVDIASQRVAWVFQNS